MKIKRLEIKTGNINAQLDFYRNVMGLKTRDVNEESFELLLGYSILKFISAKNFTPYHMAFHIPDKQEEKALEWLKDKVAILKNEGKEIIDFPAWNARSVYFYDRDGNIIEFISRRDFNTSEPKDFSAKSLLGIAEIGLPTANIKEKFDLLNKQCELEIFDGNFEVFCAIGDDSGLLITIDKNKKDWFPTQDKAYSSNFSINFTHKDGEYNFDFNNDCLESYT
ncbi:VOC family protein [Antarcticibacterium arcticum]|uniref:VOC family protein n=1 Tax=Antarcticibacterium arcticum TaxID=2585771 RepID=A0A5B8YEQ3_9FLAO|nr:VOC family protein [Antarcticibacterium arcticum]QED36380.1 VOC family protein [Antarcticibacterium arcticum]